MIASSIMMGRLCEYVADMDGMQIDNQLVGGMAL